MKPLGPIPAGYAARDGQLAIGGFTARELVAQAGGTPLFVYSRQMLDSRMAELRAAMPERLAIHYAVKANPWHPVIEHMKGLADGFDIASGGELTKVLDAGSGQPMGGGGGVIVFHHARGFAGIAGPFGAIVAHGARGGGRAVGRGVALHRVQAGGFGGAGHGAGLAGFR